MRPVRTGRVRYEAAERPVLLFQTRVRVLAVGGNGRVQTASDMWLFLEHRTHCSSVQWLPVSVWCPRVLPNEVATTSLALGAINRSGGRPWLVLSTLGT